MLRRPVIAIVALALALVPVTVPGPTPAGAAVAHATSHVRAAWDWPLVAPHPVTRSFEAPATPYAAGHRGIDIAASTSSLALAPADGIVHFSGVVVDRPVVSIEHAGGYLSSFEPVESDLRAGTPVARGQPIGTVVAGHCPTRCLHFGVRLDGEYVSPLLLLGEVERAVLLPMDASVAGMATRSGARVGRAVALFQPLGRNVRVELCCSEARVAEHFLYGPQIRAPVE